MGELQFQATSVLVCALFGVHSALAQPVPPAAPAAATTALAEGIEPQEAKVSASTNSAPKDSSTSEATAPMETVRVESDRLHVLPTEPVESVFGFGKNALETPRAVTSISNEMLDKVM